LRWRSLHRLLSDGRPPELADAVRAVTSGNTAREAVSRRMLLTPPAAGAAQRTDCTLPRRSAL